MKTDHMTVLAESGVEIKRVFHIVVDLGGDGGGTIGSGSGVMQRLCGGSGHCDPKLGKRKS